MIEPMRVNGRYGVYKYQLSIHRNAQKKKKIEPRTEKTGSSAEYSDHQAISDSWIDRLEPSVYTPIKRNTSPALIEWVADCTVDWLIYLGI